MDQTIWPVVSHWWGSLKWEPSSPILYNVTYDLSTSNRVAYKHNNLFVILFSVPALNNYNHVNVFMIHSCESHSYYK